MEKWQNAEKNKKRETKETNKKLENNQKNGQMKKNRRMLILTSSFTAFAGQR